MSIVLSTEGSQTLGGVSVSAGLPGRRKSAHGQLHVNASTGAVTFEADNSFEWADVKTADTGT